MIIRKVTPADNLRLATMIRAVFDEHNAPHEGTVYSDPTTDNLYALFQKPGAILFVAEDGPDDIGCCGIYPTDALPQGYVELVKFYMPANMRGKKIGKTLLEKCFAEARSLGYTHMYIESHPAFAKAVHLYEQNGFVMLSQPLGNSGHGGCNIWMEKAL